MGIVSLGIKCGATNILGVFTRVTHYIDWISSATEMLESSDYRMIWPLCTGNLFPIILLRVVNSLYEINKIKKIYAVYCVTN